MANGIAMRELFRKIIVSATLWGAISAQVGWVSAQTIDSPASVDNQDSEPALVHHSLRVILDPQNQSVSVEDTVTVPDSMLGNPLTFSLNSNLSISNNFRRLQALAADPAATVAGINNTGGLAAATTQYSLSPPRRNSSTVLIIYSGTIFDTAEQTSVEYAQSFAESSGIISEQGVYLNKGSAWVPDFGGELISFDLRVEFASSASS